MVKIYLEICVIFISTAIATSRYDDDDDKKEAKLIEKIARDILLSKDDPPITRSLDFNYPRQHEYSNRNDDHDINMQALNQLFNSKKIRDKNSKAKTTYSSKTVNFNDLMCKLVGNDRNGKPCYHANDDDDLAPLHTYLYKTKKEIKKNRKKESTKQNKLKDILEKIESVLSNKGDNGYSNDEIDDDNIAFRDDVSRYENLNEKALTTNAKEINKCDCGKSENILSDDEDIAYFHKNHPETSDCKCQAQLSDQPTKTLETANDENEEIDRKYLKCCNACDKISHYNHRYTKKVASAFAHCCNQCRYQHVPNNIKNGHESSIQAEIYKISDDLDAIIIDVSEVDQLLKIINNVNNKKAVPVKGSVRFTTGQMIPSGSQRIKKRLLPRTVQQKNREENKKTEFRRFNKLNITRYGLPFKLQLNGLGQVNP